MKTERSKLNPKLDGILELLPKKPVTGVVPPSRQTVNVIERLPKKTVTGVVPPLGQTVDVIERLPKKPKSDVISPEMQEILDLDKQAATKILPANGPLIVAAEKGSDSFVKTLKTFDIFRRGDDSGIKMVGKSGVEIGNRTFGLYRQEIGTQKDWEVLATQVNILKDEAQDPNNSIQLVKDLLPKDDRLHGTPYSQLSHTNQVRIVTILTEGEDPLAGDVTNINPATEKPSLLNIIFNLGKKK